MYFNKYGASKIERKMKNFIMDEKDIAGLVLEVKG
jgi:hypothetical protein